MAQLAGDVRGVMIPVTEAKVLLPNASVSEVITYGNPQPVENAPEWVFGVITWRGWRIPLFSFSLMAGQAQKENFSGAKVAIIKALSGEGEMPYMALLAQGFPRLTQVTDENVIFYGDQDDVPQGVKHVVAVNDDPAFVPDLDGIEQQLLDILAGKEVEGSGAAPAMEAQPFDDGLDDEAVAAAAAEIQDVAVEEADEEPADEAPEAAAEEEEISLESDEESADEISFEASADEMDFGIELEEPGGGDSDDKEDGPERIDLSDGVDFDAEDLGDLDIEPPSADKQDDSLDTFDDLDDLDDFDFD